MIGDLFVVEDAFVGAHPAFVQHLLRVAAEIVAAECVVLAETKDHLDWELLGKAAQELSGDERAVVSEAYEKIDRTRHYEPSEAVSLLKQTAGARFDESRDVWVVSTGAGEEHSARGAATQPQAWYRPSSQITRPRATAAAPRLSSPIRQSLNRCRRR